MKGFEIYKSHKWSFKMSRWQKFLVFLDYVLDGFIIALLIVGVLKLQKIDFLMTAFLTDTSLIPQCMERGPA